MTELSILHILILAIVTFVLYHFMNRCNYNGFSVGVDVDVTNFPMGPSCDNQIQKYCSLDNRCEWNYNTEKCNTLCNTRKADKECVDINSSYTCGLSIAGDGTDNCGWYTDQFGNSKCRGDVGECITPELYEKNKHDYVPTLPECGTNVWVPKYFYTNKCVCHDGNDPIQDKSLGPDGKKDLWRCE